MNWKQLRISKNLTQVEASELLHIPLRTYKRLENAVKYEEKDQYRIAFEKLSNFSKKEQKTYAKPLSFYIIGAGFVGASTAYLLSRKYKVCLYDSNIERLNALARGSKVVFPLILNEKTSKNIIYYRKKCIFFK